MDITQLFPEAFKDPVIRIITISMAICFLLELYRLVMGYFKESFKPLIISLGILGTFTGILLGLWEFKTDNIDGSIPQLLEGLKTAFITSVLGMGTAIVLAFIENWIKKTPETQDEVLKELLHEQKQTNTNIGQILELVTQAKTQTHNHFEMINQSLNQALQTLSKGATQEVINALKSVITDFNKNLTEQFGENFKQLNEAVKKMTEWQENYKSHINQMEKHLQTTVKNMKQTSDYTKQFTGFYEKISHTIEVNQNQINNMEKGLKSLHTIGQEAGLITSQLNQFSKQIQTSLSEQSEGLNNLSKTLNKQVKSSLNDLDTSLGTLNKALTSLTNKFRQDYKVFLNYFEKLLDTTIPPAKKD